MRNPDNVCPQDERFGEVIEVNEPTDSEAQETVPTGNEIEEGYLPSSDPIGKEEKMDLPMEDVQDLEERTEQEVNTERESSENINLR